MPHNPSSTRPIQMKQDNVDAKHQIGGQNCFSFQMVWMIHDVSLPYKALWHNTTNIISNGVIFELLKSYR